MTQLIFFYWHLLMRRAVAMLALVVLFVAIAVAYAVRQPNSYEATAKLLVEAPQISEDLAASTVTTGAGEELTIIQERLFTRANLIDIANKFDVYQNGDAPLPPDEIVKRMRAATSMRHSRRRGEATFVDVTFSGSDPKVAAAVVNEFVTRILSDNVQMRTQRAGNTLEFFEQEVNRLSEELSQQSGRISKFKASNSGTLPEALNFRMSREAAIDERLAGLQRERAALEDQRQRVVSVFEETGRLRTPEASLTPEERQLRDLESQLSSALAIYSDTNPRVTVLRTRIAQLRNVVAGQSNDESGSPTSSVYEVTLAEIDARAAALDAQIGDVTKELTNLRKLIEQTPQTAIALESLERNYSNIQSQYDAAISRLARARTGEQIELTAQGQRITIVENAIPPQWPTSPNRRLITAAGGLAGVAAAAGLFALLEVLNTAIRRPGELVSRVGITPLAVIPYIPTRRQVLWKRILQVAVLLLFFVGLPAALFTIDTYFMPLEELFQAAKDGFKSVVN